MLFTGIHTGAYRFLVPSRFHLVDQVIRAARFGRVGRFGARGRLKDLSRLKSGAQSGEFLLPFHADATALRPPKDIWKALGFTVAVCLFVKLGF